MYRFLSNSFVALGDCSKHSWSIYVFKLSVRARKLHVYASSFHHQSVIHRSSATIPTISTNALVRSVRRLNYSLKSQSIRILITSVRLFPPLKVKQGGHGSIVLGSKIIHHPSQACTISFPPPPPNLSPFASLRHSRPCLSYVIPSNPSHPIPSHPHLRLFFVQSHPVSIPANQQSLPTKPIPSSSSLFNFSTRADEV